MKTLPEDPELPTDEEGAPDVELGLGDKDPPRTRRHPIEEERSPALADRCFQSGFHGTCPGLTKLLRRWWMSIWGRYWNKNRVSHEITRTTPVRFSRTSASSRLVQSRITTLAPFGRGLFQAPYLRLGSIQHTTPDVFLELCWPREVVYFTPTKSSLQDS